MEIKCPDCGQVVSGPASDSVKAAMDRHLAKSGHGPKKGKVNANKD